MERLAAFRPHLTGAVWRGTATRLTDIHIELFCDDPKAAEIALIDQRVDYEVSRGDGPRGRAGRRAEPVVPEPRAGRAGRACTSPCSTTTTCAAPCSRDARGRTQRGDLAALQRLLRGRRA